MVDVGETQQVYQQLCKDPANSRCFDCTEPHAPNVSLQHAVFICDVCAREHRLLDPSISFVQPITVEWSEKQLEILEAGGNPQLQKFFDAYDMPRSVRISYKYNTVAAQYYRAWLRAKAANQEWVTEQPEFEEGRQLIVYNQDEPSLYSKALSYTKHLGDAAVTTVAAVTESPIAKTVEAVTIDTRDRVSDTLKFSAAKSKQLLNEGMNKAMNGVEWSKQVGEDFWLKCVEFSNEGLSQFRDKTQSAYTGITENTVAIYKKLQTKAADSTESALNYLRREQADKNTDIPEEDS